HPKGSTMTVRTAEKFLRKSPQFVGKWVQRYKETKCVDESDYAALFEKSKPLLA
ncbi:hypothetical protein WN51_11730, partial [Melipona quadrifasciata]